MKPWTIAAVCAAVFFYALAVNDAVYEVTSPYWLSWHVVLRKAYSIGAFAIVGYLIRRAIQEWGGKNVLAGSIGGTALYSAAIEVGQFLGGSQEGLGWNTFDTLCGALGAALANLAVALVAAARR